MTESSFDYKNVESGLNRIFDAASSDIVNWNRDIVRKFIDNGEYNLALDDLAAIYLRCHKGIPNEVLHLFEILSALMDTKFDPEYQSVVKILSQRRR